MAAAGVRVLRRLRRVAAQRSGACVAVARCDRRAMELASIADNLCEPAKEKVKEKDGVALQRKDDQRHEFWSGKRKKQRERLKEKKNNSTYEDIVSKNNVKFKWKNMPLSEIAFNLPRICLDASFESELSDKEITSVGSQILHAYGFFKRCERPIFFHLSSFGGKLEQRMRDFDGFDDWKIFLDSRPFFEVFNQAEIVYLSPESDDILHDIDENSVYIIGAIADHNRLKGLSARHARSIGVKSARLPIDQYLQDTPNVSLNINHVFEIMVNYAASRDWKAAFLKSVPTRKSYKKLNKPNAQQ